MLNSKFFCITSITHITIRNAEKPYVLLQRDIVPLVLFPADGSKCLTKCPTKKTHAPSFSDSKPQLRSFVVLCSRHRLDYIYGEDISVSATVVVSQSQTVNYVGYDECRPVRPTRIEI